MKNILTITLVAFATLCMAYSPAYDIAVTNLAETVKSESPNYVSAFNDLRIVYNENRDYEISSEFLDKMVSDFPYANKQQRIAVKYLVSKKKINPMDFEFSEIIDWMFEPVEYTETYIEPQAIVSQFKKHMRRAVFSKCHGKELKNGIRAMSAVANSAGFIGLEKFAKDFEMGDFDVSSERAAMEALKDEYKTYKDDKHLFRLRFILTESEYMMLMIGL